MNQYDVNSRFMQTLRQIAPQLAQQLNGLQAGQRVAAADAQRMKQEMQDLAQALNSVGATRSGGADAGVIRIENIPGRRVPFTLLVDIPIGAGDTSKRQASVTISQEGPFVAVKRMAAFQSAMEVRVTDPTSGDFTQFVGRSYGRYRPIHSAMDLLDSQHNGVADTAAWWWNHFANAQAAAGDFMPGGVIGLPSNMASFRTMEFDGRVTVINAGSSYPRQNLAVPTTMWADEQNGAFPLGALDFWERGEVITIQVEPNHVSNPPAGNVAGRDVIPTIAGLGNAGGFPFLAGQFDAHEGIATPEGATFATNVTDYVDLLVNDAVQRLPNGILTIGWEGYRIIQPIGPVG
jgi:hypothetical protein